MLRKLLKAEMMAPFTGSLFLYLISTYLVEIKWLIYPPNGGILTLCVFSDMGDEIGPLFGEPIF